jgi:hypothetical protein
MSVPRPSGRVAVSSRFERAFLAALDAACEPLTIDDLLEAGGPECRYSDIVRWLATALTRGIVRETPIELDRDDHPRGQRHYVRARFGTRQ